MSGVSLQKELRKYGAVAIALVLTLIVSTALFVHFLRVDHARALDALSASTAQAAHSGRIQLSQLIERVEILGQLQLHLQADVREFDTLIEALEPGALLQSLCAISDGSNQILFRSSALDRGWVQRQCSRPVPDSTIPADETEQARLRLLIRPIASQSGDEVLLEIRAYDQGTHAMSALFDPGRLLDEVVLRTSGLQASAQSVCLSIRHKDTFHELGCHRPASDPMLASMATGSVKKVLRFEDFMLSDQRWRISVTPNLYELAGAISLLPFVIFGVALAVGGIACVFAYYAVDRNLLLEARTRELHRHLEHLADLKEQNSLLDQLATMAAHDLQAPLRFTISIAHILVEELEKLDQEELVHMARRQIEQGDRMQCLILDLLEFCRAGQGTLAATEVDVRRLVDDEVQRLSSLPDNANARIIIGPLPRELVVDADKLEQVIRNLLSNAVKFSRISPVPTVSISATRDSLHGSWTFRVKDNGPGIEPTQHDRIFRPFARLNPGKEGTGMGLAIVKVLLERLGGSIWIDSDDPCGSTFCFTVPGTTELDKAA